jgi:hypothetical protein
MVGLGQELGPTDKLLALIQTDLSGALANAETVETCTVANICGDYTSVLARAVHNNEGAIRAIVHLCLKVPLIIRAKGYDNTRAVPGERTKPACLLAGITLTELFLQGLRAAIMRNVVEYIT